MSRERLTQSVLILTVVLSGSGCAALHKTDPPLPARFAAAASKEPLSYALLYDLPSPDAGDYRYARRMRDRLAALLSRSVAAAGFSQAHELSLHELSLVGVSAQAVAESLASAGSERVFIVRVESTPWPTGSNGAAAVSGLTLGLIPTWETMTTYVVESARYEAARRQSVMTHTIKETQLFGIIFLPISWMTLTSTADRELEKTIRAGLLE